MQLFPVNVHCRIGNYQYSATEAYPQCRTHLMSDGLSVTCETLGSGEGFLK